MTGSLSAQYATNVTITDFDDVALKNKMEQEATKLLTAFNNAYIQNSVPSIDFVKNKQRVLAIWEMYSFKCIETDIVERAYKTSNGYQLRNIPMFLKDALNDDVERNIAINFDKGGNIYDISFIVNGFWAGGTDIIDFGRMQRLLDFIENYLTAYFRKDISFITNVFSDALILTGREFKIIKYSEKDKSLSDIERKYLAQLKTTFEDNKRIDIELDEIKLQQHPKYDHIHGVAFKQNLSSTQYCDVSYIFLYFDYKIENEPLIKVRIWQPYEYNEKKYDLEDFM